MRLIKSQGILVATVIRFVGIAARCLISLFCRRNGAVSYQQGRSGSTVPATVVFQGAKLHLAREI